LAVVFCPEIYFPIDICNKKISIIMNAKFNGLTVFVLLLLTSHTYGQLSQTQLQNIDSLFIGWNTPMHPGGTVAIMKDGRTVFSKAYGLASLEYQVLNSTETIFNIGSLSKQFTAMGIVLLNERNKLSFDDDIRIYIPELPIFEQTISIRHLLHHTSGLRDIHGLLSLAGWRTNDMRSNADLNRIIFKQNALNFKPGEELLYCNTGYMLLVNIIEKVTGENFKSWMKAQIFDKLGMDHTYVEDEYNNVVPNNATSYGGHSEFKRKIAYWNYVGSGNMHSTTDDLLIWMQNFSLPQKKWASAFAKILTIDPLNNGTDNFYAFGLRVEKHFGKKIVQHGGAIGGFRSFMRAYPEDELNIVILSNFTGSDILTKANNIAELIFPVDKNTPTQTQHKLRPKPKKFIKLSTKKMTAFEGVYWNTKEKYGRKIYVKNDTLRYLRSDSSESLLVPTHKNSFKMLDVGLDVTVIFEPKSDVKQMRVLVEGESPTVFELQNTIDKSIAEELSDYKGKYYSQEIETTYTLSVEGSEVYMHHIRHGKIKMKRLFQDYFKGDWPIDILEIKRNDQAKVEGIRVSNGRVRNFWFKKIE